MIDCVLVVEERAILSRSRSDRSLRVSNSAGRAVGVGLSCVLIQLIQCRIIIRRDFHQDDKFYICRIISTNGDGKTGS